MTDEPAPRRTRAETDPLYRTYHDAEWGIPERGERGRWGKRMPEEFQAGWLDHRPAQLLPGFGVAAAG